MRYSAAEIWKVQTQNWSSVCWTGTCQMIPHIRQVHIHANERWALKKSYSDTRISESCEAEETGGCNWMSACRILECCAFTNLAWFCQVPKVTLKFFIDLLVQRHELKYHSGWQEFLVTQSFPLQTRFLDEFHCESPVENVAFSDIPVRKGMADI